MKILVRMPNWLGDMVMGTGFIQALQSAYPGCQVDVIAKKGLESLIPLIPGTNQVFPYSKQEWKGLRGGFRFGKMVGRTGGPYDLFICLPDSFSSALMGMGTQAKERIGFKKELRSIFLTKAFNKPAASHRVDQYISLLSQFTGRKFGPVQTHLELNRPTKRGGIFLNFNSEAESRRMPVAKAVSILDSLLREIPETDFFCIGSIKDRPHIASILKLANHPARAHDLSGQTKNIAELASLVCSGLLMFTTDSGPAHLANAIGLPTIVSFGAGNEARTSPYNKNGLTILRLGQLPCEPCERNFCKFGSPKCLEELDVKKIIAAVQESIVNRTSL